MALTVLPGAEKNAGNMKRLAARECGCAVSDISALVFRKKSIDARHGRQRVHLRYSVYIGEEPEEESVPDWKRANGGKRVIVVGSGPAGLFACLTLIEAGITPVLVERGSRTEKRKKDIAAISTAQAVCADSNYCFGLGGAGTFSDGKLYTRSVKRGNVGRVMKILRYFGAPASVLTDSHPHIGTDNLPSVIENICALIASCGGELHFDSRCTDFILRNGRVAGVRICRGEPAGSEAIYGDALILAAGHSANDMYQLVSSAAPAALEAKTFAMGVRVEHPRSLIDSIQYHGKNTGVLPAAEYRLTAQIAERGVYSFCMCPGGFIVPSASGDDEIVVNGMSPAARDSRWSNAAIVVEMRSPDASKVLSQRLSSCLPLPPSADCTRVMQNPFVPDTLKLRSLLEYETKRQGQGQKAPAQRLADFLARRDSLSLPASSYTPGLVPSRLDCWLPEYVSRRLEQAFYVFERKMKGFICDDALLVASETRTSSPVRIRRDSDTLESPDIAGLFPAGEGAGYAGGIVSSALDGEKAARCVCAAVYGL